ncbi:hypothetical protein NNO_0621 [Hydrogenimonas sp.]|nr:hypothetical protein NNO_0621 [Hydrogenimonas sp.]
MKIHFESPKAGRPDVERGIKVPYAPERRKAPIWRWYLLLALILSPVIYFAWILIQPLAVITAPGFLRLELYGVDSHISGRVTGVYREINEQVQKGEPLFEVENIVLLNRIEAVRKELKAVRKKMELDLRASIAAKKSEVTRLSSLLRELKSRCKEVDNLIAMGAATSTELMQCRRQIVELQINLIRAGEELRIDKAKLRNLSSDPKIVSLQSSLNGLMKESKLQTITAEVNGTLENIQVKKGEYVHTGKRLADIIDDRKIAIDAYFDPKYFDYLKKGDSVIVKFPDGYSVDGFILDMPRLSSRLPSDFTLLKEQKRAVLVRIGLKNGLLQRYRVAQMPVEVRLKKGVVESLWERM